MQQYTFDKMLEVVEAGLCGFGRLAKFGLFFRPKYEVLPLFLSVTKLP